MTASIDKHVVAFPYQAWGHARPLSILATRMVKLRPVYVTILVHDGFLERVKAEIVRGFEPHEHDYAKRIRVATVGLALMMTSLESDEQFKLVWEKLVAEQPITCTKTQEVLPALPKPDAVIIDLFAVRPFESIKEVSGDQVKVFNWHPALTYEMFWYWGPEKLGGCGNVHKKVSEEAERTGRQYIEVLQEMAWKPKGEVVRIPAFPPIYDYEHFPQAFPPAGDMMVEVFPRVHATLAGGDGVLLFSSESYEPEAVAAVKAWYAETSRAAYVVGPLHPSGSQAAASEKKQSKEAGEVQALLDSTLKASGEHSLLYISFGSIFWPINPEAMWAALEVIMELNIPFILSHASPFAVVPDDIREKVKSYGKGVISAWTPQQAILDHPATGWFMAHGGHNGVMEALSAGVPQILWPFIGDQPLNAIYMSDVLNIAYELIEVRSGPSGLHPIYRNGKTPVGTIEAMKEELRGVLGKAFGEDGAQKRQKVLALREQVSRDWSEGGSSLRDVSAFLAGL
ncbi:UDP-Glycosyltransferase/glycogen phosphorylase [Lenzites betulinus]|nr:UDP-Glycosyltransferase/glycogen phosphorylase [Lenzites betulinus]